MNHLPLKRFYKYYLMIALAISGCKNEKSPLVIAHRGACGYLPEHTLASKAMAYAMGADYLEQDIVMTKDNKLVISHDIHLNQTTNVVSLFPDRARPDGYYYVIDFTLKELKKLKLTERFDHKTGKQIFENRFPLNRASFQMVTLEEEIEFIQGLNAATNQTIGIYPEIKSPSFHHREGTDIALEVLKTLKKYGYQKKHQNIFLQCFDPNELNRVKNKLFPELDMELKLVQLVAETSWNETVENINGQWINYNYDWMLKPENMSKINLYADGIGFHWSMLVEETSSKGNIHLTGLASAAKKNGLKVHVYTFRADDKERFPKFCSSFNDMLRVFSNDIDIDGFFTDHPDKVIAFLAKK